MTSKNKAQHMAGHPVNNATFHTARSNPLATKLTVTAMLKPQRKQLFKTNSNCSARSSATDTTTVEKFVRFGNKDTFRKTLSIKDYTPDEVRATWYVSEDYQRILRQCQKEIRKINQGGELKDKKYCSRGLQGFTNAGRAIKERSRILTFNAVLNQQLAQWDEGIFDEDAIAEIYIRTTSRCQMWANAPVGQQQEDRKLSTNKLDHHPLNGVRGSPPAGDTSAVAPSAA
jgi:hypothetical protein